MRWGAACICALMLAASPSLQAAEHKRVLLAYSFGREFAPFHDYAAKLRSELSRQFDAEIEFYEVALATARSAGTGERDNAFVDYVGSLFTGRPPDLVITVGGATARYFQRHRQRIFSTVPLLLSAVDERWIDKAALTAEDAVVATKMDLHAIIANILQVLPQTDRVAVVIGASPLETLWVEEARRELQPFADRLQFTWFNSLSLGEILDRAATLPPRSAIFFGVLWVDAAGVSHADDRALAAIRAVANAPIFSFTDTMFGRGIVGGPMFSMEMLSNATAAAATRILKGETPQSVQTAPLGFASPVFDWRELQRFQISEARLPAGSLVSFRQPKVWDRYKREILAVLALFLVQAGLISWLLTEHRKRRRSEREAHGLTGQILTAQENERARLARELHDDVTQRLALLAIDAGREEKRNPDKTGRTAMREIREGLAHLSQDVHALAYNLHPSVLGDLGLREALRSECDHVAQTCSFHIKLDVEEISDPLSREVGLCVFRIAQESLRNIARHAMANQVALRLRRSTGGLHLTVLDDGCGFDHHLPKNGPRLGHASMRQRVALVNGTLRIVSKVGKGTLISAWVPIQESK